LWGGGGQGSGRDLETLNNRVQGLPVGVCPMRARGFMVQGGRGEGDRYGYVVGTGLGEGGFPAFNQAKELGVCKREVYDGRASFAP